jgi:hypothetical protein
MPGRLVRLRELERSDANLGVPVAIHFQILQDSFQW